MSFSPKPTSTKLHTTEKKLCDKVNKLLQKLSWENYWSNLVSMRTELQEEDTAAAAAAAQVQTYASLL